jgi:hypothetical protein
MYQIPAEWRWWVCELLSQAAASLVVLVTGLVSWFVFRTMTW